MINGKCECKPKAKLWKIQHGKYKVRFDFGIHAHEMENKHSFTNIGNAMKRYHMHERCPILNIIE